MAVFPPSPIPPADFLEGFVPEFFSGLELSEAVRRLDLTLGVRLDGPGGGEWLYALRGGALEVAAGSREAAAFTLIQSVDDWRGALWEGRGGYFSQRMLALLLPGATPASGGRGLAPDPGMLEKLAALDCVVRAVVTGGPAGDWSTAFKFGPGAIPEEPTTTVSLDHGVAAAMARNETNPVEAFMAGRITVAGDVGLLMRVQAIVLEAAEGARGGP